MGPARIEVHYEVRSGGLRPARIEDHAQLTYDNIVVHHAREYIIMSLLRIRVSIDAKSFHFLHCMYDTTMLMICSATVTCCDDVIVSVTSSKYCDIYINK